MSWSTEKDSKQRKRNYCYAKTSVLPKGCFAGRMVKPFKAFKRQQHSTATGLLVITIYCEFYLNETIYFQHKPPISHLKIEPPSPPQKIPVPMYVVFTKNDIYERLIRFIKLNQNNFRRKRPIHFIWSTLCVGDPFHLKHAQICDHF